MYNAYEAGDGRFQCGTPLQGSHVNLRTTLDHEPLWINEVDIEVQGSGILADKTEWSVDASSSMPFETTSINNAGTSGSALVWAA